MEKRGKIISLSPPKPFDHSPQSLHTAPWLHTVVGKQSVWTVRLCSEVAFSNSIGTQDGKIKE